MCGFCSEMFGFCDEMMFGGDKTRRGRVEGEGGNGGVGRIERETEMERDEG